MKTLRRLALPLLLAALPAAPWAAPESAAVNIPDLPAGLALAPAQPPANARANATNDAGAKTPAGAAAGAKANPAAPAPAKLPEPAPASAATATAAKSNAKAPPPLSPRVQLIRDHIAELLQYRNATPAPPDPRYSAFRPAALVATAPPGGAAPADGETLPAPPNNDLTLLQQAVATMKVRGVFRMKTGSYQLVINSGPNKEGTYADGAVINVSLQGEPAHIRVRQITAHSVTFALNDAELKLSF